MTLRVALVVEGNAQGATQALDQTTTAIGRVTAASGAERAGLDTATIAARVHTQAIQAMGAASRMVAYQQRMLAYQVNDIFVSLASGMNPAMVLIQQGSQIFQMGMKDAASAAVGLAARFAPVAAGAGLVAAAFAGMTAEINKTAATQVSFGDVFAASFRVAAEAIGNLFKPAIDQVVSWASQLWSLIAQPLKDAGNGIVGAFELAYRNALTIWQHLPAALGDFVMQGVKAVLGAIDSLLNDSRAQIVQFMGQAGAALGPFGAGLTASALGFANAGRFDFASQVVNPWEGREKDYTAAMQQNMRDVAGKDYLGDFYAKVSARAQELARANVDGTKEAAKAVHDLAKASNVAVSAIYDFGRDVFTSFFADLKHGARDGQSALEAMGNAGANALDRIADRMIAMAAESAFNMLFGLGFGSGTGGLINNLLAGGPVRLGFNLPGLAVGGPVEAGRPYLVGERGPELVVPRAAGTVLTADQTSMLRGGGVNYHDNRTYRIDGGMNAGQLRAVLEEARRRDAEQLPRLLGELQRRGRLG